MIQVGCSTCLWIYVSHSPVCDGSLSALGASQMVFHSHHAHRPTPLERFPTHFPQDPTCGTTVQPSRPGHEHGENIEFQLGI